MTPAPFSVHTTAAFDREFRKLARHHRDLIDHYRSTLVTLANDPYNRSRAHNIKKLEGVAPGGPVSSPYPALPFPIRHQGPDRHPRRVQLTARGQLLELIANHSSVGCSLLVWLNTVIPNILSGEGGGHFSINRHLPRGCERLCARLASWRAARWRFVSILDGSLPPPLRLREHPP
jgi:hypothetical protein